MLISLSLILHYRSTCPNYWRNSRLYNKKIELLVRSKTITAALQSLRYEGIKEWNLYWPAVSQSCILRVLLSTLTVLETKSTPTVGLILNYRLLVSFQWNCRIWICWWLMFYQQIGPLIRPLCIWQLSRCLTFF